MLATEAWGINDQDSLDGIGTGWSDTQGESLEGEESWRENRLRGSGAPEPLSSHVIVHKSEPLPDDAG